MNMFGNIKQLASLMGNAKEMREKAEEIQAELARKTVEGDAGAGAVRVTMSGKMEVQRVELDRPLLMALAAGEDGPDQAMVEELIAAATNDALIKARQLMEEEMAKLTGGMDLGAIQKMLGE